MKQEKVSNGNISFQTKVKVWLSRTTNTASEVVETILGRVFKILFVLLITYHLPLITCYSAIPQQINFQGRLTNAQGTPLSGNYKFVFSIWDTGPGTGGTGLWSETQDNISVTNGVYSVTMGTATPIPTSVFDGSVRWMEVAVTVAGGGSPETLSPRAAFVSVPYSYRAERSDLTYGIIGDTVTSANIKDDTITNTDINTNAGIVDTKLATISTPGKVADSALSSNVDLLSSTQTITADKNFVNINLINNLADGANITFYSQGYNWKAIDNYNGDLRIFKSGQNLVTIGDSGYMTVVGTITTSGVSLAGMPVRTYRAHLYGRPGESPYTIDSTTTAYVTICTNYSTFDNFPPVTSGATRKYYLEITCTDNSNAGTWYIRLAQSDGTTTIHEYSSAYLWGDGVTYCHKEELPSSWWTTSYSGHTKLQVKVSSDWGAGLIFKLADLFLVAVDIIP